MSDIIVFAVDAQVDRTETHGKQCAPQLQHSPFDRLAGRKAATTGFLIARVCFAPALARCVQAAKYRIEIVGITVAICHAVAQRGSVGCRRCDIIKKLAPRRNIPVQKRPGEYCRMPRRWCAPHSAIASEHKSELEATQGSASAKVRPVLSTPVGNRIAHQRLPRQGRRGRVRRAALPGRRRGERQQLPSQQTRLQSEPMVASDDRQTGYLVRQNQALRSACDRSAIMSLLCSIPIDSRT